MPLVASNRIGEEAAEAASLRFYGASFIADETGAKLAEAGDEEAVITARFDLERHSGRACLLGRLRDRRPELYGPLLTLDGGLTRAALNGSAQQEKDFKSSDLHPNAETPPAQATRPDRPPREPSRRRMPAMRRPLPRHRATEQAMQSPGAAAGRARGTGGRTRPRTGRRHTDGPEKEQHRHGRSSRS